MSKSVLHPVIRSAFNLKRGLLTLTCWFSLLFSVHAQVTPVLNLNSTGNASLNIASLNLNDCFTSTHYAPSAAAGDGHAMWLSNNPVPLSTTDFVFSSGASFIDNGDGTATLKGILTNTGNPLDQWEVNLYLSSKSNWTQWSSLGRTYKDEKGLAGNNYTDWSYYIENPNLTSNIVGLLGNIGKTVEITHMPANHNFGFQIGTAANNKNSGFGLSGWFNYSLDGQNYHQGDFNLDLSKIERVINYTSSKTTFDCSNLGLNTVTITSTDQFGGTCNQQVTVNIKDVTPPVVVTKNIVRTLVNGTITISANDVLDFNCSSGGISSLYGPNTLNADGKIESIVSPNQGDEDFYFAKPCTSDNCSIASFVINKKTFNCSNIGENIVTATVTDQSGNVTTATAIVYIRDTTIPVAKAKNITVALNANGIATITPQMINNGSSDACGTITLSLNKTTFDCSNLGYNQVTLIVTDNSGNTKTTTASVTVIDNTPPVVVTKNITLNLDQYGQASIADALDLLVICDDAVIEINNGGGGGGGWEPGTGETGFSIPTPYYEAICTKDNCSITNVTVNITDFDCSNIGQNTVTVTVTDASGNSTSETAIVTINDITPPTVITKNIAVNLDANGNATITPAQVDNGSSDICGVTLSLDKTSFGCSEIGTHTVTLTATDASGNTTSKTATVTVADNTAPTVITKDITVALDANGNASITTAQVDNGSFDNCGITLSIDKTSFDCALVGPQTVTLTGIDPSGNTASATATVTVVDNTAPTIVTQNITVTLGTNGKVALNSNQIATVSDNCEGTTFTIDYPELSCDELGDTNVTITATDANGNISTAIAVVTVQDITPPTVVTKNITRVLVNGTVTVQASDVLDFNCSAGGISQPTPVPGAGDEDLFFAKPCTSDNCTIVSYEIDKKTFDCTDAGQNIVTATVTDQSGNVTTATAIVYIIDNSVPTAIAQDITVALDENGIATITPQMIDNGSAGTCGQISLSLNKTVFDCSNLGYNQVTLIVTNISGTTTTTATVEVIDNTPPVVVTKNITLNLDQYGQASIADALDLLVICDDAVVEINNGGGGGGGWEPGTGETGFSIPTPYYEAICTKDNCSITNVTVNITDFDCSNIGQNTVTVTVTDASGNSTSETAIVTINDITPPTVITKNIAVNLDANGNATITPAQVDNGSSDICGVTLSLDKTSFGCSEIGTHTVTLTATDASGNTTSKTATVTVADNTAPTVITKDITVALDANGNASITTAQVDNGSFDNCGITLSIDKTSFDCALVGPQTVTLTGIDPSGNTASATATVTVVDNIAPTIVTQNITVTLDANGNASINSSQVDNGTTDNCGVSNIELSKVSFDCSNLGDNTVTVTATDASGNVSTKSVVITVIDNIAPTVIAKDITVTLDANGNANLTATQVDNGSFDNCDITLSIDKLTFDCADAGTQTVTLTGIDASGNTASATANVTVIDNNAPVVETNDITVVLDANGNASITANDLIDNTVEVCTVVPYAGNSNHSVAFQNYYPNNNTFIDFKFDANGGQLVQYADGTAMVTGTIVNGSDPNDIWVAQLNLDQKRNWTEWSGLGRSWKGNANTVGNNYKDWSYYQMSTSVSSTFTGAGNNAGQVKTITHMPGNYNYGFQVGQAANDKNGNYGMSGWFFYTNGQGKSVQGDFNMDITSCTVSTGTGPCDPESIEINKTDFDCSNLGDNTVTLTVTDSHGNTTTKTSIVTIVDNIAPTVITQDVTVALDANGNANITTAQVDNGSSDNCNLTLTVDKTSFNCNDLGAQTVTLTGTDASGNTASATATVTVIDNTAPVITVNNSITVEVDENGNATITQSQVVTSVGDDNCGNVTITISKTSFDCTDLGTNTITVTATDASGNVTTETVTVTVVDTSAPVFTNPTSGAVISQNPTAPAMDFNVFVRNNVSFKNNETEGAVALGGDLTIDGSYQVSTNSKGSFKVSNVPVTLVVGGKVNYTSGNSLQVNQNGYVKIGNANGAKVWYQDQNGANSPIRITKDNNYNSSPRLHLQANAQQLGVSASNNPIFESGVIDFDAAFAQFEASALSMSQLSNNANLTNPNGQPISNTNLPNQVKINLQDGLNVLNVTGTDLNNMSVFTFNNQPSQSKILIINVNNPGTFNWNVYNTGGIGEHVSPYILYNFYNSTTVKIQGNGSVIGTVFAPYAFINKTSSNNISGQVIGKSFTQLSGENHMFGFSGTITSGTTTEIEEGSIVVRNADDCTYEVEGSEFTPAVTDNGCSDLTLTYVLTGATTGSGTDLSGESFNTGQTVITWTATDGSNTSTFSITVNVEDNTAPTVITKNITIALDANGNANITAAQVDNGSFDNCNITLSIDKTSFDCTKVGAQTVTLTGTDASGNTASATATVTVIDNTAPTVITQNITVSLNASGNAIITAAQINNGSSDNCGIASVTVSKTSFDCSNLGDNTVTLTVTDNNGNTSTQTATVTIVDNIAPTVITQDITVALDANGNANITTAQVDNGSSDNCSLTLTVDKTSFDCNDLGAQTVTLTGTDASGNTASATATVTVVDNTAPTVITQNISITLDANGNATITATQVNNGSSDNCNVTLTIDKTTFNCADAGTQTVTLTGTDASGNSTSATAIVTVIDNNAPEIVANNITVALDDNGNASVSVSDLVDNVIEISEVTAFQGGNNHSIWLSKYTPSNQAVLFQFDSNGGHLTQYPDGTATVTGTIVNPNDANDKWIVQLNIDQKRNWTEWSGLGRSWKGNGNTVGDKYKDWSYYQMSTSVVTTLTGVGSNAGKVKTLNHMPANYNYGFQIGQAANDKNGNYGMSGWFFYTNDQGQAVQGDFNLDITSTTVTTGTGPCDPESITISQPSFDCDDLGQNTVTLTVTDAHGNTSTETAIVTVVDNTAPIFTSAPSNKIYQAETGNCTLNAFWAIPVVTDNCLVSVTSTHNSGDAFPIGTTKVTYTATDAAGNTSSIDFNVTVQASPMSVVLQADTYTTPSGIYNVSCNGAGDGKVMLAVTGGCGPYTYLWSNGSTTKNLTGVDAGSYSVTVTDNNGTQIQKNITLTAPAPIVVEKVVTTEQTLSSYGDASTIYLGFGEQTAVLQANASGGSGDFTYQWSPIDEIACSFDNTITVAPQVTTTYTVVVTDSNGCSTTENFTINVIDVRCDDYNAPGGDTGGGDGGEEVDCQCEGKMQNFTVVYNGFSGVTIKALKKDKSTVIKTFNNVQNGDQIQVTGFDHKGRLDSKTYLQIGNVQYEIHTSCSISIINETYGPFTVTEYTDGEGSTCSGNATSSSANFTGSVNPTVSTASGSAYGKKKNDDDNSGSTGTESSSEIDCQCEGRMENFTIVYQGESGKTVKAYNKKMDYLIETYYNVQYGDTLFVEGFDKGGRLEAKTMLMVDWTSFEVHTSCSINILGAEIGPFKVVAYTDGAGFTCSLPKEDGGNGGDNGGCDVETINWTGNVTICYNGQTYCVTQEEAKTYLALGASLGSCSFNITSSAKGIAAIATGENTETKTEIKFEVSTYPNPASDLANITFNVNQDGPVTVAIFDTRGLQVGNTLFEENAEIDRKYTVVFDASSVKEGIYIIRLRTAGYIESQKLLIKK